MFGTLRSLQSGSAALTFLFVVLILKTVFPVPLEQIEAELMRAGRWEGQLVHTKKDGTPVVVGSRKSPGADAASRQTC
jgi:hypothetical protein